jgi:hypothetical protein
MRLDPHLVACVREILAALSVFENPATAPTTVNAMELPDLLL